MKLRDLTYIFAAAALIACSSPEENPVAKYDSAVYGYLDGLEGQEIYLALQSPEGIVPVDTAIVSPDGYFEFPYDFGQRQVYRIVLDYNKKYLTIAAKKGDKIYLEADGNNVYDNYYVEGSLESELIKQVVDYTMYSNGLLDSLRNQVEIQTANKNGKALSEIFALQREIYTDREGYAQLFINDHPGNIAAYFQVLTLPTEGYLNVYEQVAESLTVQNPGFNFLPSLKQQIKDAKAIQVGSEAPNLTFPSPSGEEISLTELRGKYVLLDFWASWCKPCRMENPNLVKLYKKYQDQGFEIYGYSLDNNREAWVNAIESDGLSWTQTSDLAGWKAQGARQYSISAIPASFLIDPNGVIIARDLRGEELREKLSSLFEE